MYACFYVRVCAFSCICVWVCVCVWSVQLLWRCCLKSYRLSISLFYKTSWHPKVKIPGDGIQHREMWIHTFSMGINCKWTETTLEALNKVPAFALHVDKCHTSSDFQYKEGKWSWEIERERGKRKKEEIQIPTAMQEPLILQVDA